MLLQSVPVSVVTPFDQVASIDEWSEAMYRRGHQGSTPFTLFQ
jgi:hypothetical protein